MDEKSCFILEMNECKENEYRCHNGICIPEELLNDNSNNPDCLDQSDEMNDKDRNSVRSQGSYRCFQDPSFRCEESDPFYSYRGFVCGDGQQITLGTPDDFQLLIKSEHSVCANDREYIHLQSVLIDALRPYNLTIECQRVINCISLEKYRLVV